MSKRTAATTDFTQEGYGQIIWFEDVCWPALLVEPTGAGSVRIQCEDHRIEIPCNAWSVVKRVIENAIRYEEEGP